MTLEDVVVNVKVKGAKKAAKDIDEVGTAIDKTGKKQEKAGKKETAAQKRQRLLRAGVRRLGKEYNTALGPFKMTQEQFAHFNKNGGQFNNTLAQTSNKFRMATAGLRGFRMEMLGVMFFGMAMQRMFTGLLKPAMETAGVFEIWSSILEILFLPIVLAILPYLVDLLEAVANLSPEAKTTIGMIALLGVIIGTTLFLVGTLTLGFGALAASVGGAAMAGFITFGLVLVGIGFIVVGITKIFRNWGTDSAEVIKGLGFVIIGLGVIILALVGPIGWAVIAFGALTIASGNNVEQWGHKLTRIFSNIKIQFYELMISAIKSVQKIMEAMSHLPGLKGALAKAALAPINALLSGTQAVLDEELVRNEIYNKIIDGYVYVNGELVKPLTAEETKAKLEEDLATTKENFNTDSGVFEAISTDAPTTDLSQYDKDLEQYKLDLEAQKKEAEVNNIVINQELNITSDNESLVKRLVGEETQALIAKLERNIG